ncbi:MAG: response regulator [Ignavibacteriae bacterium]|nr:response regulator [Ignavibacteriota bacterium]
MNNPPKILLVDDDEIQLQVIAHAIQSIAEYTVLTTTSPIVALQMAEKHEPDVILSDFYMPEEDGFSFCRKVKAHPRLRSAFFILLTSAATIEQRIRGFDIGADDYITKPFHAEELLARIRAAMRIKSLNDQLQQDKVKLSELYQELEADFMGVITLLTQLIGHRVPNASIRGERAAAMARWIGERLEMKEADIKLLEIAGRLHEIGKVNLPDEIIRKPLHQLTEGERSVISHFPLMGQAILEGIPRLNSVGTFLRHQMENFDGSGYPDRLAKDQIPLSSRILRSINFIESETAARNPGVETLIAAMNRSKATVLDPHIVQLMAEYLEVIENPTWREGKIQVSVYELKPGMIIAHDLTTGSGTKLLSNKAQISNSTLERILAHHQYDPILNNIYVYDA